jgi:hypothetical protein
MIISRRRRTHSTFAICSYHLAFLALVVGMVVGTIVDYSLLSLTVTAPCIEKEAPDVSETEISAKSSFTVFPGECL